MIIPAREHHVDEILQRGLRAADVQECLDLTGRPIDGELRESVQLSEKCWAFIQEDGSVCALFGVAPCLTLDGCGIPWALATDDATRRRKDFVRLVRPYSELMGLSYKYLSNFVSEDHVESIRWLKYAGFQFIQRFPEFGVARKPFLQFYKAT
jgi:hypothetical protein